MGIEEIADIYNDNLELIGQAPKSEIVKKGLWCKSFHCWIIRPSAPGFILFQKRSANKKTFPNYFDISAAGHYIAGETIQEGVREIEEELHKKVEFSSLISLGINLDVGQFKDVIIREFCYVFMLCDDTKPEEYLLELDEVEGLIEISIPDGLELFSCNRKEIIASGIKFNHDFKKWEKIQTLVNISHFVPRNDNYFYKILILAERYLRGEKHLVI